MVMEKRFKVEHRDFFPMGAFMKGVVEAIPDFDAPQRSDGSRPQLVDKETGLPMWQVIVLDPDEEASKRDTAITVKLVSKNQPVPPDNPTDLPLRPVEFVGLTVLPWVEYTGGGKNREGRDRTRVSWSLRADDLVAPGEAKKSGNASNASGPRAA